MTPGGAVLELLAPPSRRPGSLPVHPEVMRDVLVSWAQANGVDVPRALGNRPIVVDLDAGTLTYWRMAESGGPVRSAGAKLRNLTGPTPNSPPVAQLELPLAVEPAGVLVDDLKCGHVLGHIERGPQVCVQAVGIHGRHKGAHTAGAGTGVGWGNSQPGSWAYYQGRPLVDGLDPVDAHLAVQSHLDQGAPLDFTVSWAYGQFLRDAARETVAGRRALVERHKPDRLVEGRRTCGPCAVPWPCVDYATAAAGVVSGLEVAGDAGA